MGSSLVSAGMGWCGLHSMGFGGTVEKTRVSALATAVSVFPSAESGCFPMFDMAVAVASPLSFSFSVSGFPPVGDV